MLLGGLDASAVDPIARRMASPVFSARLAFYRSVTHYLHDEDRLAAALVADALSLARSAGATFQVANNLMALGGWRARLPEATTRDVFGPLLESAELWERLRIPWGRVLVLEEIAQALAIRGHPAHAVVLFAAIDAGEVQAPAKVGRERRAGPHLSGIDEDDLVQWRTRGTTLTIDQAMALARDAVVALLA